ncbi:MAG: hypothetical protein IPG99_14995 [Ignavibacteria bacterium]|nr:hypothetical protein [Ignavibacteria bacterium]
MRIFTLVLFFFATILTQNTFAQWSNVSTGLGNKQVYSFTNNSTNLFAGTFNYGLYTSTDNGMNWTMAGIGLNNRVVFSLTTFGNYLYAGTDIGIWRTSNNGAYWTLIGINNNTIYSLASNTTRIFAGLHTSGLFYSSGGSNWFISSLNVINIKSIAVNGNFILAGAGGNAGVHLSTNNGNNWTATSLNNKSVYSLAMNGSNAYAGTGGGVYYSRDSGYTWTRSSLNNDLVYSLAVAGSAVYAGTELNGVFLSTDNGLNWSQLNDGLPGGITIYSLYLYNNYVYAGASLNGVYRRPVIELPVTLNQRIFMQGSYNPVTDAMVSDTVSVYLRNAASPYEVLDFVSAVVDSSGYATFEFSNAVNGVDYYIQLEHRNSLETWSNMPQQFSGNSLNYDFTTDASQAFGNNIIQVNASPIRFGIYSGDTDQDGTIDASDLSMIDNDATAFVSGYAVTDLTGDSFVDGSDFAIGDNNASNFVSVVRP